VWGSFCLLGQRICSSQRAVFTKMTGQFYYSSATLDRHACLWAQISPPRSRYGFSKTSILCIEQAFLVSLTHILRLISLLDSILDERQPELLVGNLAE
jgi:hypothetical protein